MHLLRIFFGCLFCGYAARELGWHVDLQYRETEGKPRFVHIPQDIKWMFHFRFFIGTDVVREGLWVQVMGYIFCALELLVFLLAAMLRCADLLVHIADGLVFFYILLSMGVLIPMGIRYEHNLQLAFDRDFVTYLQNAFTMLPKRRCKVVSQVTPETFEITLGYFKRKRRLAKAAFSDTVGARMYAVHSYEHGSPFWEIRSH